MLPVRIAFDPSLPVIATAAFDCGARRFVADDPFPWRDLGISEFELLAFWRSGLVSFVAATAAPVERIFETPSKRRRS